jgi:hypothetical protein
MTDRLVGSGSIVAVEPSERAARLLVERFADTDSVTVVHGTTSALAVDAWFVSARVLRQPSPEGRLAHIYDRFAVPVIRRIEERRAPRRWGQSLLCVAHPDGSVR